jgi:hypothetical protein
MTNNERKKIGDRNFPDRVNKIRTDVCEGLEDKPAAMRLRMRNNEIGSV